MQMFEKRFKIYDDAIKIMNLLINRQVAQETDDFVIEFNRDVLDSRLLLPDLVQYLEEIRDRAQETNRDLRLLDMGRGTDAEKKTWQDTYEKNHEWFSAQIGTDIRYRNAGTPPIIKNFGKYLCINESFPNV